ncbi:MAG: formate dehydrogenase-N subunit alpha [Acidobacteria bacterium 13_1_40CM_4_65_8]|nr:MAG: formate dehydrogenase-N subunit alpha [Acidobacteria bacterium 13_1_40CM_4_65_8]OLE78147.1 MAG: formate dehydrogenase-N subunit alpha [Acidobacteria bacterium 13_1_20CM_2_65_9]
MTNGWIDIKNTDVMLIMGGNPAENHPCGFKWPIEAKLQRNAKMIVVDPRFTRTAATADLFLQIRAGADIAFLGGVINYAIQNGRIAHDYVLNFTNAAFIVKDGFKLPEDGLYSGFDAESQLYDQSTWNYEAAGRSTEPKTPPALPPNVAYDPTFQHPRCVFQLLKQQYSRYTPEMVERITGIPKDQFLKAADLFTSIRKDGDLKKVATIIYAVGWTQHTFGTQIIRTAAMLQLLLGNVGRAGGGVNALRGHSNIQGATDMAGVFDILPGYLKVPNPNDVDYATYLKRITPTSSKPAEWESFNYWSNTPKFAASFLKAMYGDAANKENDFAFHYLPKIDRNYAWTQIWDDMYGGTVKGIFAFGMNGVQIGPNSRKNIEALKKADWLVVGEIYPDETSEFWKAPGTTPDEMKKIQTTVYRLPCAGFAEKDGAFVNSARWLQWKNVALPPPGDARLDQDILAQIFLRVRELYQKEGGRFPDPILNARWPYTQPEHPALGEVAREINGQALADITDATGQSLKAGQQLPGFAWLKDDGTTLCGNWLYSGSWTEAGNQMARRGTEDPSGLGIYPNWAWSWPANRRVLYNRASCDPSGKPWDAERRQVWWNESTGRWVGNDVPDFKVDSKPSEHMGPFIMNPEGIGRLFAPLSAFADGPFPEHYEPIESPISNPLHPSQSNNPVVRKMKTPLDTYGEPGQGFTVVCTTYRLTEHYHYWTKNNPMNVQLVPEPFIEIPVELADEMGLKGGELVKVSSARASHVAKAMVTRRIKPMVIDGRKTYQIGVPIHGGYRGIAEDAGRTSLTFANLLSPTVIDPNAYTPEFKGFLVKIERA